MHTTARADAQAHNHGPPSIVSASFSGPGWDCAGTGPHPRRDWGRCVLRLAEWWGARERQHSTSFLRMQAHTCSDVDADSCSDVDADSCSDVDAHSCADVDVRACLHAPYHARCGLTGTHAQACTMTHAHDGTCRRTSTQSWASKHSVSELFRTGLGLRRHWSTSAPGLGPMCAATGGMVGRT